MADMRIAIIGDVHAQWAAADTDYFARSGHDLVLFVGDLPSATHRDLLAVASRMASLRTPAILIPGNHDGTRPVQVLAEATRVGANLALWRGGQQRRIDRLRRALGSVALGGYSVHPCGVVDVVACRPHAMDGRYLSFQPYLAEAFGISDLPASAARLRHCVDQCTQPIVFLSHNGPSGLGDTRDDLFGRSRPEFDNGDRDLAEAIAYARSSGHRVLASVSGHMHHSGDGGMRRWTVSREGVRYVNAARVPRVFRREGRTWRHCVELDIDGVEVSVREHLYEALSDG